MADAESSSELISEQLPPSFPDAVQEGGITPDPTQGMAQYQSDAMEPDTYFVPSLNVICIQEQQPPEDQSTIRGQATLDLQLDERDQCVDQPTNQDSDEIDASLHSQPDEPLLEEEDQRELICEPLRTQPFYIQLLNWIRFVCENNKKTCLAWCVFIIIAIMLFIMLLPTVSVLFYESNQAICQGPTPMNFDVPMTSNSTVILLNISTDAIDRRCFEPFVEVITEFPVGIYQTPCKSLPYSNIIVNRVSRAIDYVTNPLPPVFDESYQNYLINTSIKVTVNFSTEKSINPSAKELFYFCLFTDYDQFKTFKVNSTKGFWKTYVGAQCTSKPISLGNDTALTMDFVHPQPDYIFIGVGSTIDPLKRFQFNFNVSGKTISDPKLYGLSEVEECADLSDQNPLCNFFLNLTDDHLDQCIVASRPVDRVSRESFKNLKVKWLRPKPNHTYKIYNIFIAKYVLLALLITVIFVIGGMCIIWIITVLVKESKYWRSGNRPLRQVADDY